MSDLMQMAPEEHRAKIFLLGKFDTERNAITIIKDPYFVCYSKINYALLGLIVDQCFLLQSKGSEGFKACYEQCVRCCDGFLKKFAENQI